MSAWVKQIASQVVKLGPKASWYCEWDEPDGSRRCKSCGAGTKGKRLAETMAKQIRAEVLTGTYNRTKAVEWVDFRKRYVANVVSGMATESRVAVVNSLNAFERVLAMKSKCVTYVTSERIAQFAGGRRKERGRKPGSTVSPATINKDLRHVKAALRVAADWGYLPKAPTIKFEGEPQTLPRYITSEHFAAIYKACDVATMPSEMHVPAAGWWRALLIFGQMTGWRIGEMLSLEWSDVDLEAGTAITRAVDNKGKRDEVVGLHAIVLEHIRPLRTFHENVFPWEMSERRLYDQFAAIQDAAGIKLPCRIDREHDCTDACHRYAFHDERRAFATMNAANMTREALQSLMRHSSSLTTERYINFARQMKPAVANLYVPNTVPLAPVG